MPSRGGAAEAQEEISLQVVRGPPEPAEMCRDPARAAANLDARCPTAGSRKIGAYPIWATRGEPGMCESSATPPYRTAFGGHRQGK